jgi:heme-binding protein
MSHSRMLSTGLLTFVGLLIAAQLVPYGRRHSNPPDGTLVAFDSPATQKLAVRACYDCHSNRTRWPWYASIAPLSWRIQHHVDEGREKINFTDFTPGEKKVAEAAGEAAETVTKGEMPPQDYLLFHPEARLSALEKDALAKGLSVRFAAFGENETDNDRVAKD